MVFTWQSLNFAKCNKWHKQKINFLPNGITTAHSRTNLTDDNDQAALLKHFYKFRFDALNAKPDITECFMVIYVEQPDKTLLYWCKNK